MHPSARVIGTDLSPIQPSFVPPNVQFEIDDCCDPWLYQKNSFDFVHVRGLYGCVSDWDKLYREAYKCDFSSDLSGISLTRTGTSNRAGTSNN
jgi:hypothetical protein